MEYQNKQGMPECFKIMLVSLKPDGCKVLKGPREEIRLAEILRDDYHTSRYEKILGSGEEKMACSYQRKVEGVMQPVSAEIFPRRFGEQGELEEFIIYVYQCNDK